MFDRLVSEVLRPLAAAAWPGQSTAAATSPTCRLSSKSKIAIAAAFGLNVVSPLLGLLLGTSAVSERTPRAHNTQRMAPGNAAARTLDSHHTFTVEYRPEQDRGLSMHEDDAHVLCWS